MSTKRFYSDVISADKFFNESYRILKFKPRYTFKDLVKDMIESDLKKAKKELQK